MERKKKHKHFFDPTGGIYDKKLIFAYTVAAKLAIKYGGKGRGYSQRQVDEFWDHPKFFPSARFIKDHAKVATIKSVIHNNIQYDDPIWTADFLHGLMRNGKIIWNKFKFPSVKLYNNSETIQELIRNSPFGGKLGKSNRWSYVGALYLKFSEKTIPFMAGVLAPADIVKINGITFAKFNGRTRSIIENFGIPIEKTLKRGRFLISPIWVLLLTPWMPKQVKDKWKKIKKPAMSEVYCPILWKTYVGSNFIKKGIPFLRSRRYIFYRTTMKPLQRLRVSCGLTELDTRIKEVVKKWSKNQLPNN